MKYVTKWNVGGAWGGKDLVWAGAGVNLPEKVFVQTSNLTPPTSTAMPYDPLLPRPNTPLDADEMRAQLNGLKSLIDAVPGGVTEEQLTSAINGTAKNADGVAALYQTISDPPTQGEVQAIQDKLNELIMALRRNV
jgi:hypothetical protein